MFHTLGIKVEQIYGDVYASWLRDTFEKNSTDTQQFFRDMVESGFLDRQVILRRQRLGVNVVTSLATALHRSPLTRLDVHGNALRDIGCEVVAHLMSDLPNLTYLDLGANGITGAGARSLGFAVAQHSKLAVLILSSNRREDPYPNELISAAPGTALLLQGCLRSRSLRHLDLSGNQLGDGEPSHGFADDETAAGAAGGAGGAGGGRDHLDVVTGGAGGGLTNTGASAAITAAGGVDAGGAATGGGGGGGVMGADKCNEDGQHQQQQQTPMELISLILTRTTAGSLTSLKLHDVGLSNSNAIALVNALRLNASLSLLDLSDNNLSSGVADALGRLLLDRVAMQNSCVLTTLCLSGNTIFLPPGASTSNGAGLGGSTRTGKRLHAALSASSPGSAFPFVSASASAENSNHQPAGQSLLLASLANDRILVMLELDRCGVDANAVRSLCRALLTNGGLKCLSLRSNAIDADAAVDLGRALCRHGSLQKLYLSGNAIEDEGACALAAVIEGDRSGSGGANSPMFSLGSTSSTSAGRSVSFSPESPCMKNANSSINNSTKDATRNKGAESTDAALTVLDLQHTWLGDRGLIALGVALQGNNTLRFLLLGGNHFTSQGGETFAALLEKNESIVACELGATSVPCPTVLRLQRCVARNRHKLEHAEGDALKREVVRLHFQKYKLEEAKNELEGLRDRSANTKLTAENYDLQFKQDQSDYTKRIRELEEQIENYTAQNQRYEQQAQQLEVDLRKAAAVFQEDMVMTKERLEAETRMREKVEEDHRQVEAELVQWKTNAAGRESAKRETLVTLRNDMEQWATQRKQYRQEGEQLQKEVRDLEAKTAALLEKKRKPSSAKKKRKA